MELDRSDSLSGPAGTTWPAAELVVVISPQELESYRPPSGSEGSRDLREREALLGAGSSDLEAAVDLREPSLRDSPDTSLRQRSRQRVGYLTIPQAAHTGPAQTGTALGLHRRFRQPLGAPLSLAPRRGSTSHGGWEGVGTMLHNASPMLPHGRPGLSRPRLVGLKPILLTALTESDILVLASQCVLLWVLIWAMQYGLPEQIAGFACIVIATFTMLFLGVISSFQDRELRMTRRLCRARLCKHRFR